MLRRKKIMHEISELVLITKGSVSIYDQIKKTDLPELVRDNIQTAVGAYMNRHKAFHQYGPPITSDEFEAVRDKVQYISLDNESFRLAILHGRLILVLFNPVSQTYFCDHESWGSPEHKNTVVAFEAINRDNLRQVFFRGEVQFYSYKEYPEGMEKRIEEILHKFDQEFIPYQQYCIRGIAKRLWHIDMDGTRTEIDLPPELSKIRL